MTKEMQESIDWLCGCAFEKKGLRDDWELYELFKRELRARFARMKPEDYDSAIKQYTKLNLRDV